MVFADDSKKAASSRSKEEEAHYDLVRGGVVVFLGTCVCVCTWCVGIPAVPRHVATRKPDSRGGWNAFSHVCGYLSFVI